MTLADIYTWFDAQAERALKPFNVTCRRCTTQACCAFAAEISEVEVSTLKAAVDALPEAERAEVAVAARAWHEEYVRSGLDTTPLDAPDYERRYSAGLKLWCPLFDHATRKCRVYAARPLACRAMWRVQLTPCRDNSTGASPRSIEYLRAGAAALVALLGAPVQADRIHVRFYSLAGVVASWFGHGEAQRLEQDLDLAELPQRAAAIKARVEKATRRATDQDNAMRAVRGGAALVAPDSPLHGG